MNFNVHVKVKWTHQLLFQNHTLCFLISETVPKCNLFFKVT